jgi:hypothetical protein
MESPERLEVAVPPNDAGLEYLQRAFELVAHVVIPTMEFQEACELLKCDASSLRSLLAASSVPGLRIGREWVIPRRAFIEGVNALAVARAEELRTLTSASPPR